MGRFNKWTEEDVIAHQARTKKPNKYRNKVFMRDGEKFRSEKEYKRYQELKLMQKAGEIEGLQREVPFELVVSVRLNDRRKPAIRYFADFTYTKEPFITPIVEDVKSEITRKNPVYRLKKHLLKAVYDIEIVEI